MIKKSRNNKRPKQTSEQKTSLSELQLQERMMMYGMLKEIAPLIKDFLLKKIEAEKPKFTTSMWILGVLVFLIIVTTAGLTYVGIIGGESFTFLMGVIIGYIMTHLKAMFVVQEE